MWLYAFCISFFSLESKAGKPVFSFLDSFRHAYRFRMEEERAAVRAVLHFGAKDDTSDDNAGSHGESWWVQGLNQNMQIL